MSSVVDRAQGVRGVVAAARLREQLGFELGRSNLPFEREADLDQAIQLLEDRFPEVRDVTDAESFAQEKGAGRQDGIRAKAKREAERGPDAAALERAARAAGRPGSKSSQKRGGRQRAGGGRPRADRSRPRVRAGARRAFERTGVPRAARSATQITLQAVGLTIGLSLLYLLLSNGERSGRGGSLLEQIGRWITGSTRALVAPVDPLGDLRAAPAGEAAAGLTSNQKDAAIGATNVTGVAMGRPGGAALPPRRPGGQRKGAPRPRSLQPNNRGPGRRTN